jgi:hypothetical protein
MVTTLAQGGLGVGSEGSISYDTPLSPKIAERRKFVSDYLGECGSVTANSVKHNKRLLSREPGHFDTNLFFLIPTLKYLISGLIRAEREKSI